MKPYSGARLPVFWCACLVAAAGLLAIEMSFLTLPGIQQDEALFLQPFLHGGSSLFSVAIGGSRLPVMLMDYIGCLKTWLYWPIFQIWHPGVWSIRLPVCIVSAGTLLVFAGLVRRVANGSVAFCAALLLGTDASFLFTNAFDWGPVALLLVGAVAFIALLVRSRRPQARLELAAAFLLAGVLLWYKTVFAFPLAGISIAFVAVFPRQVRRRLTPASLATAAASLLVGASPLLLFNVRTHGATLAASSYLERVPVAEKLTMMRLTLDGKALEHYMFRSSPGEILPLHGAPLGQLVASWYAQSSLGPGSFLFAALALSAGALAFIAKSRLFRPIVFAWVAGIATTAFMLAFRDAGAGPHHTVLVYPAPQFIVAATIAALAERLGGRLRRWVAIGAVGLVMSSNCVLLANYRRAALRNGFSVYWTDATRELAADIRKAGKPAAFLDWGIEAGTRIESGDTVQVAAPDPPRTGILYVTHYDGYRIDEAATSKIRGFAISHGLAMPGKTIVDSHGREIFFFFELRSDPVGRR